MQISLNLVEIKPVLWNPLTIDQKRDGNLHPMEVCSKTISHEHIKDFLLLLIVYV